MREQLLRFLNDLRVAEEREYQVQYELDCLREEKKILEKESERLHKPGELEKKSIVLKESSQELRREFAQRRPEIKVLQEDMEATQRHIQREQQELDKKKEVIESCESELVRLHTIPGQLGKEMEGLNRKKMDLEKKKAELEEQVCELTAEQRRTESRGRALEEERQEVMRELEERRGQLRREEQHHNQLLKEKELAKEKEAILMGERAVLDINHRDIALEKKRQHDMLSRNLKEEERQMRSLKKAELQLKLANDALVQTQFLHKKVKSQMEGLPKGDGLLEQRQELQKEVEILKHNVVQEQSLTEQEAHMVEYCLAQQQDLVQGTQRHRKELARLTCLTQIKADEREQKSRDLVKVKQQYDRIKQELRSRSLVVQDHKKQYHAVQSRLNAFAKLHDIIKDERDKCENLIQMASQRTGEMGGKFKILENEREILETSAFNRDRQLQRSKLKHLHSHMVRDSLRKDISSVGRVLTERSDKREEQKLNMGKLTHMVSQAEEALQQLRRQYEGAVQSRNDRRVQLIEREEELCIFQEKVNIQEGLIRVGNAELKTMEEDVRFTKMLVSEEARQIELTRRNLPSKRALEQELVNLQIQLSKCQDRCLELEKALEDPSREKHIRLLEGADPKRSELLEKIKRLELHLAEREQQLLERNLVYEQVARLAQRLSIKEEDSRPDALALAKKVNRLKGRIRDTTRRMMALMAELSMQETHSLALQKEVQDKEVLLEACHRRLEQGLPPSDDMDMKQEQRRAKCKERARVAEEEEWHQLPSGVYTSAEARPNAYIPQDDPLPVPRPYGALAPFKPSKPGTNLRHIRKPMPKPIEI
ncbi:CC146 protein, partial [Amia calva]|nr:CC146 protein [Amia calva]